MIAQASRIVHALVAAERQIALLERVRPIGFSSELERLVASWEGGNEALPRFCYTRTTDLASTRRGLDELVDHCESLGNEGSWLGERARELAIEAEIAEAIGTETIGVAAAKRFRLPALGQPGKHETLDEVLAAWSGEAIVGEVGRLHLSDDRSDESSLFSILQCRLRSLGVRAEVRVECDLVAVAAVCDQGVVIRPNERMTQWKAQRIAEHEIVAHLLPRQQARCRDDILRCGCQGASEDEEGRALVIEMRTGLMDASRRRELAFRHLAACWSRQGADFVQVVRRLGRLGAQLRLRVAVAMRAFRGAVLDTGASACRLGQGGLGRELGYLPAYLQVKSAFAETPSLEHWFTLGRTSLRYAKAQESLAAGSARSTQTGT